ncbi:unnamed protein product [Dimorphilus gyrociliatus]|uniref:Uncharacterized protein n=1 Tax=Dimorphilus gyrociliatus TaxID=2664684 RepID=A0A7I8WDF1_9ANNE|nr:unnamed protein product [Dimorphilus gyrociliatus]
MKLKSIHFLIVSIFTLIYSSQIEENSKMNYTADEDDPDIFNHHNGCNNLKIQSQNYTIQGGYYEIVLGRLGVIGYETGTFIENPYLFDQDILIIHGSPQSINEAIVRIENIIEERRRQFETFDDG